MIFWYEIVAIIVYIILLIFSVLMLLDFYVCDHGKCKIYDDANQQAPLNTKENVLIVTNELGADGAWCFPFLGASIIAFVSLWFLQIPVTTLNVAILFIIGFLTIYALFSFYTHHYILPVKKYISGYIDEHSSDSITKRVTYEDDNPICYNNQLTFA